MVYKLAPYAPDQVGFGRDDARFLARQGFTTVRLGLIWARGRAAAGEVRRRATSAGSSGPPGSWPRRASGSSSTSTRTSYHERFQGEGAPTWAVQDDGLRPSLSWGSRQLLRDARAQPGLRQLLGQQSGPWWRGPAGPVRRRVGARRGVLPEDARRSSASTSSTSRGPAPAGRPARTRPAARSSTPGSRPFSQRVIDAIREVDRSTAVFYEPNVLFNNGAQTSVAPVGQRLGFSFHDYCLDRRGRAPRAVSTRSAPPRRPRLEQHRRARAGHRAPAAAHRVRRHDATCRTITGMVDRAAGAADRLAVLGVLRLQRPDHDRARRGAGAGPRSGASAARGANIDLAKLRALVVPHPLAVSGTPLRYRFDRATARFTARWSVRAGPAGPLRRGRLTTISVPRLVYGSGYTVRVAAGGSCRSRVPESWWSRQRPGVDRVRVVVRPR